MELLKSLTATISEFQKATAGLDHASGPPRRRRRPMPTPSISATAILPAMTAVRTLGDKLETMVADDLWPLPTYREMLFIK